MFGGDLDVQLGGENFKIHYPNISVMRGVKNDVSLFFNNVSKIPVFKQMIVYNKSIYNLFGSSIHHKPYSIFNQIHMVFTIETLVYSV